MKRKIVQAAVAAAVVGLAAPVSAAQFTINSDIWTGSGYSANYTGAAGSSDVRGAVSDGGYDAFDTYGYYIFDDAQLDLTRQSEAFLDRNLYRFFDTFTNSTGLSVTTTLTFSGNLGSDGSENVRLNEDGLTITCQQGSGDGCSGDPVLALVSGNNGLFAPVVSSGFYNATATITLDPGETLSLLNFAFLARDLAFGNAPTADDVSLATNVGRGLLEDPYLAGLTGAQIARIANFEFSADPDPADVPEPAAIGLLGLGALGMAGLRRRRRG